MRKLTATAPATLIAVCLLATMLFANAAFADSPLVTSGIASANVSAPSGATSPGQAALEAGVEIYRLYNPNSGEHHYTSDAGERAALVGKRGWRDEGVGWIAPKKSRTPVYRVYNPVTGDHHYTTDKRERNQLVHRSGWRNEGIGWYSADEGSVRVGICREYNPNAKAHNHNFTSDGKEHASLVKGGWHGEGVAWHGLASTSAMGTGWIDDGKAWRYYRKGKRQSNCWVITSLPPGTDGAATDETAGKQRYWIDAKGRLATSRFINPKHVKDAQAGYRAWATKTGAVTRNARVALKGRYYLADGKGEIALDTVVNALIEKAQGYSSSSKYLIMVDVDDPRTMVFEGNRGAWNVKFIWDCDTGAPDTPTITGVYTVGIKGYSFGENHGYSCYYYTQFSGNYLFHTRKYYPGTHKLLDARMGECVSEGCVRLYDEDAIWIQDNVPEGTTVVTTR